MLTLIYTPYVTVTYEADINTIGQYWRGFCTSEQFREAITKSIEYFKQYNADKLLTDTAEQSLLKKEDTDWVTEKGKEFVMLGMKAQAFVLPMDIFTKISVKNYQKTVADAFQVQFFSNSTEAKQWLKTI
jgi:hypothetical protein